MDIFGTILLGVGCLSVVMAGVLFVDYFRTKKKEFSRLDYQEKILESIHVRVKNLTDARKELQNKSTILAGTALQVAENGELATLLSELVKTLADGLKKLSDFGIDYGADLLIALIEEKIKKEGK